MSIPTWNSPWVHNPSVDEAFALRGACGQTHLPTGRTCPLPHGHQGSCVFIPRDRAEVEVQQRLGRSA
jgi:hypothetical protein